MAALPEMLKSIALSSRRGARCGEGRVEPILNIGEHALQTIAAHGAVSAAQGDTV
jgi:hypothetical protein